MPAPLILPVETRTTHELRKTGKMKTANQILNRIDHELASLNNRYTRLESGLKTPGVDVKAIKELMEKTSDQMDELRRQAEFLK